MSADNIHIDDPASLKKAGGGATEVAGLTNTSGEHPVDETNAAAKSFGAGEWDGGLSDALTSLVTSWSSKSAMLVTKVRVMGTHLTRTADNYTAAENANTSTMSSLQQQTSPFG